MGLPRLKAITISNFRSFSGTERIEFPDSGLVLLRGVNLDTGGSSGSGKSSLNLALAYLLGFCPYPATELRSWGSDEPAKVSGEFETAEGEVVISRGSKTSLTVAGETVKGSAKQVEERLYQLLGLGPEMLSVLTYRGQRKPGMFLSKTDAEKKDFLTQLLGLDKLEEATELGAARVKGLEGQLTVCRAWLDRCERLVSETQPTESLAEVELRLATTSTELSALEAVLASLREQDAALRLLASEKESEIPNLFAEELRAADIELKTATNLPPPSVDMTEIDRLSALVGECKKRLDQILLEDSARKAEQSRQAGATQKTVDEYRRSIALEPTLLQQQAHLTEQIEQLRLNTCPTCERPWDTHARKRQELTKGLEDVSNQLATIERLKLLLPVEEDRLASLREFVPNAKIERFQQILADTQAQLASERVRVQGQENLLRAERQQAIAEAKAKSAAVVARMQQALSAALFDIRKARDTLSTETNAVVAKSTSLQRELGDLKTRRQVIETQLQLAQRHATELAEAQVQLAALTAELNAELDFLGLIGREGFLGLIFDEVLAEISDETNRILASVANTRHCTLRFASESTTQKGTVKRAIVPLTTVGGQETSLYAGLSGGMLSSVELAVDLAVGAVISRRSGACPGWLVLDESFEGLDPVSKESCLEILQTYSQDRLVLVVDHASEFKSLFSKSITVEFTGGTSRIA